MLIYLEVVRLLTQISGLFMNLKAYVCVRNRYAYAKWGRAACTQEKSAILCELKPLLCAPYPRGSMSPFRQFRRRGSARSI